MIGGKPKHPNFTIPNFTFSSRVHMYRWQSTVRDIRTKCKHCGFSAQNSFIKTIQNNSWKCTLITWWSGTTDTPAMKTRSINTIANINCSGGISIMCTYHNYSRVNRSQRWQLSPNHQQSMIPPQTDGQTDALPFICAWRTSQSSCYYGLILGTASLSWQQTAFIRTRIFSSEAF